MGEKVLALEAEKEVKEEELHVLKNTLETQLWLDDLDAFLIELQRFYDGLTNEAKKANSLRGKVVKKKKKKKKDEEDEWVPGGKSKRKAKVATKPRGRGAVKRKPLSKSEPNVKVEQPPLDD